MDFKYLQNIKKFTKPNLKYKVDYEPVEEESIFKEPQLDSIEEEDEIQELKSITPEKTNKSKYGTSRINKSRTPIKKSNQISRITQKTNVTTTSGTKQSNMFSTNKKKKKKKKRTKSKERRERERKKKEQMLQAHKKLTNEAMDRAIQSLLARDARTLSVHEKNVLKTYNELNQ